MMLAGLLLVTAAAATSSPVNPNELVMEHITVEASKSPTAKSEMANSITLINSDQIERELAQTIHDLVRYEPGINVTDQGSRFGLSGISIRGIGGNRVKIEVDGVAVSDAFSIGSYSNASRDFVDIDSVKQVEILRGPGSALFGSDALGGVVSFVTKTPEDVLGSNNEHLDASAGFNSVDGSNQFLVTAALKRGKFAAMIRANVREGNEREDIKVDPLNDDSLNVLARLHWGESGNGALGLTVERYEAQSQTEVDSREGIQDFTAGFGFPYIIETTEVSADDTRERTRTSLGQEWTGGRFGTDFLRWRIYRQDSTTRQFTFEARETSINGMARGVTRNRNFTFDQELTGFEVNAANDLQFDHHEHTISYGVEFEKTDTTQLRDGSETDALTGTVSNQVGPDLFPVRDFPPSKTIRTGLYISDRIMFGPIAVVPGLRWDRYELNPVDDEIFAADNPGISTVPLDENQFSPKLGALWNINDSWTVFAQYAEGFRAPPVNDVNVGFTNFQFGYTALPNPELQSESSEGYELGVRYANGSSTFEASTFYTDYDNFIESFQVVGFDPINQLLQFQSVNVDKVEIEGAEFKGRFGLPFLDNQIHLLVAAAYANGHDSQTGSPLSSIAPPNGVVGIEFNQSNGQWGASFVARGSERQDDLDTANGELLSPAGYVVFDAFGYWKPTEKTRIRAGVYNLTDRNYTSYLDVQGILADTPNSDSFQRPGINFSVAFDWTF